MASRWRRLMNSLADGVSRRGETESEAAILPR